jgi:hypothetical protein
MEALALGGEAEAARRAIDEGDPSRASIRATALATADLESPIRLAARVKLPASTVWTKATMPCSPAAGITAGLRLANKIPQ